MKCCFYDVAVSAATRSLSLHHSMPTITTYQPPANVAVARLYHRRLRNGLKATLVYFNYRPADSVFAITFRGGINDVSNEHILTEPPAVGATQQLAALLSE